MAGLTRKKVKVRSKSGKVYQRSVMVKSGGKTSGRLRSAGPHEDHSLANSTLKGGLSNAGMGIGALAGGRHGNFVHMAVGAGAGRLAGHGASHLLAHSGLSRNAKVGIGLLGHAVGLGTSLANFHRQATTNVSLHHGRAPVTGGYNPGPSTPRSSGPSGGGVRARAKARSN